MLGWAIQFALFMVLVSVIPPTYYFPLTVTLGAKNGKNSGHQDLGKLGFSSSERKLSQGRAKQAPGILPGTELALVITMQPCMLLPLLLASFAVLAGLALSFICKL